MSVKRVKKEKEDQGTPLTELNRIHPVTNACFNILFLALALVCFLPIIFIFIISITDNNVIRTSGYQIFVTAETFSGKAYEYLWSQRQTILQALWVLAAYLIPWIHFVAGAAPILFPNVVIFYLQARGKLVAPGNPSAAGDAELEERPGPFEV